MRDLPDILFAAAHFERARTGAKEAFGIDVSGSDLQRGFRYMCDLFGKDLVRKRVARRHDACGMGYVWLRAKEYQCVGRWWLRYDITAAVAIAACYMRTRDRKYRDALIRLVGYERASLAEVAMPDPLLCLS